MNSAMHPGDDQLASYLDMPPEAPDFAALRRHVSACPRCAARLNRLRQDATLIDDTLRAIPAPRTGHYLPPLRPVRRSWLLVAALAALAVCVSILSAGVLPAAHTAGAGSGRLVVADSRSNRLVALDAASGAVLRDVSSAAPATDMAYDADQHALVIRDAGGLAVVDADTLVSRSRWNGPAPAGPAPLALDRNGGRVFITTAQGIAEIALPRGQAPSERRTITTEGVVGALALSPDLRRLYAWIPHPGSLLIVDLQNDARRTTMLRGDAGARALLAVSDEGVYLLRGSAVDGRTPVLSRFSSDGALLNQMALSGDMPAWDMVVLADRTLAIARGDGYRGGVERFAAETLAPLETLAPDSDYHVLAAGPGHTMFALEWRRGMIARFDGATSPTWQERHQGWQPAAAVFVAGSPGT